MKKLLKIILLDPRVLAYEVKPLPKLGMIVNILV